MSAWTGYTVLRAVPPPTWLWFSHLCLKCCHFYTHKTWSQIKCDMMGLSLKKIQKIYFDTSYLYSVLRPSKILNFQHKYRVSQKKRPTLVSLISPATSSLGSWDISQMNGDIFRYVLSTNSFLCDIGQPRYSQNNTGYQIIKVNKYTLIPYS